MLPAMQGDAGATVGCGCVLRKGICRCLLERASILQRRLPFVFLLWFRKKYFVARVATRTQNNSFYQHVTLQTTSLKGKLPFFQGKSFFSCESVELGVVSEINFLDMLSAPNHNLCVRSAQRFFRYSFFFCSMRGSGLEPIPV